MRLPNRENVRCHREITRVPGREHEILKIVKLP